MKELAQWAGFRFWIDAGSALLFEKLKISAEMETEEAEDQGQKYATAKSGKPVEVSLNVILNAKLGIDVQAACMEFLEAAKTGQSGALYMAGKRLLPFEIMMTKASTEEIQMAPGGRWVAANVAVTFKQSENGTILGGVIEKKQQSYTYTTTPKKEPPVLAVGVLSNLTNEQKVALGLNLTNQQKWVAELSGNAKDGSSGVTPAPAPAPDPSKPTSTTNAAKKNTVASLVSSKITKKTGLISVKK